MMLAALIGAGVLVVVFGTYMLQALLWLAGLAVRVVTALVCVVAYLVVGAVALVGKGGPGVAFSRRRP